MPGAVLRRASRALALALGATLVLHGAQAGAAGGSAQVSTEVPAGKTKTVRLRNLPSGTDLAVRIDADARLVVVLISRAQLKSGGRDALFKGALDRRMTFKVVIPASDDYYLVLDNRRGESAVKARATIRAKREPGASSVPAPSVRDGKSL